MGVECGGREANISLTSNSKVLKIRWGRCGVELRLRGKSFASQFTPRLGVGAGGEGWGGSGCKHFALHSSNTDKVSGGGGGGKHTSVSLHIVTI